MVRWLERNGYDVSYTTGVDTTRRGSEILEHKVFLSVGHDEYWSAEQRDKRRSGAQTPASTSPSSAATRSSGRRAGKTASTDRGPITARSSVTRRPTPTPRSIPDPTVWTGTWRDPRFSPPADGGKPENALSGQMFTVNSGTAEIKVPAADGKMRLWRNTNIASLAPGQTATLGTETLGYEWDEDIKNSSRPPGLIDLSSTTVEVQDHLVDYGSTYVPGTATHHLTLYRAPSGALVFGAGTVQWSWGLDGEHDRGGFPRSSDPRMQQATVNLLADMGTQPSTLQEELDPASQTTDTKAPTTTITSPSAGSHLESGQPITISGTATDAQGVVAAVEVSTDGGTSWHPAEGREQWSYKWTPSKTGSVTLMARSADDSANLEKPGTQNVVEVVPHTCPCTIWDNSFTAEGQADESEIEVGVKFRSEAPGAISGLRFYKPPGSTGTHIGRLWTANGTVLAEAPFTKETASGWQEVSLKTPVAISANTTYIASYYAPNGSYAAITGYFSLVGADSAPLHALADGVDGHNGVYHYGGPGGLFANGEPDSFGATNYMADVVFQEENQPPLISNVQVSAESDGTATVTWTTDTPSDSKVDYGTNSASLGSSKSNATLVTSHSVQLSGLGPNATYYFRVTSTNSGGKSRTEPNALLSPLSFITPPSPPVLSATVPASPANANSPKVVGSATAGTTVRLYSTSECTGSVLATVSATELAAGVVIPVADNSSTQFRATASGAASKPSACSAALAYVEDSAAPQTQIKSQPAALAGSANAKFEFAGEDPSGSGVASFECRRDSASPGAWATCSSPLEYTGLADGAHSFEVRAIDQAGNVDGSPATYSWSIDTAAPTTQIDTSPSALSASPNAEFKFSGTDTGGSGVASFECRRDSTEPSGWATCTSPKQYASLSDGSHKFEVRAIDQVGNVDASPASFSWTIDTTAPATQIDTTPPALDASPNAEFKFSGTDTGGSGVASFECRRDSAEPSGWATCTSPKQYASLSDGSHKFEVRAIDTAGNIDASPATYSWSIDTTAPQTQIDASPNALSASANAEFKFSGNDGSGSGVASFECRRDSTEPSGWATCTSPKSYAALTDGSHKFEVRAIDTAGNVDASPATFSWNVDTTPPSTQIDANPPALSPSGNADFKFSGSDGAGSGVASFECRRDSAEAGAWAPCVSPKQYASLADGSHKFEVRAIDTAGNVDPSPATFSWNVDTTAPQTQIDANPPALSASANAEFKFSGTDTGGSGVASFECRRDSTEVNAWVACASPKGYASLTDGAHKFEVRAIDTAGNVDASPATYSWSIDTTAPTTQIDASPNALSASPSAEFKFSGTDTGGSGVASFECRRDSAEPSAWATCTSPKQYAALTDGAHKFEVRAIDTAGNVDGSPATYSWTIDTTAPATQIDTSPSALSASANAEFKFSGTDTGGSGVASFECRRDSAEPSGWATCTSPKQYASLSDGSHKFEVRAIDTAGNVDASPATFSWNVDTTAPTTQIDASPSALSASANAEFKFSGSDGSGSGVASFECRRDSAEANAWATCTSPKLYASLSDGSHKFEVRAIDTAGNVDGSPATFSWSIDTTAPQTQIDANPPALSASASAEFKFSGSDAAGSGVASFECRRDSAEASGWATCTSPKSYAALTDGAHKFEVRAIDTAGNVDGSPATYSWSTDTAAPQTQIDTSPSALSASASAEFKFSGSDGSGSGVASFECRRDSAEPSGWAVCISPKQYSLLADGAHKFEVRAIDTAGNADASPATFSWTVDTTAPTTQIDANPPALSASAAAEFKFSGADTGGSGVASFECRRDSAEASGWATCTSPKSYAALADGAHKSEVRAIDQAGNVDGSPATYGWSIDTTAPTTQIDTSPSALSASANAEFKFSGTDTGGSGVASFECRRDSAEANAWAACSSPKQYASLSDGSHKFEVRSIDTAGNVDASPAVFNWTIDATAPQTQIDANPPVLSVSANAEFKFSGTDTGGSGVASFECRRDSAEPSGWATCTSPKSYASLTDGAHKFEVRAIDTAGNVDGSPAIFSWNIDTTAPQTQIDASPPALSASASAEFKFGGTDTGSGVAAFECRRDSAEPSGWAACTSPKSYAVLTDGTHSFEVRAIDTAGNVDGSPATYSWSIDTTAPQTQIDTNPPALSASANAEFKFSASDGSGSGVASFECRRDSAEPSGWATCTSPKSYAALTDGAHKFEVRAIDTAGNVDASPVTFNWSIDTTAPTTQIDATPNALSASANAEFKFSASDGSGSGVASFECRRDSTEPSGWATCTSPKQYASLTDGAHKFEVRAIDTAGNVDASPATFSWNVDTTPPSTQIDANPAALSASGNAEFKFSGSDGAGSGVASFECRRDSAEPSGWATCTSPKQYASLSDGSHKFEVRAIDTAGNVDASPATFSWTIDTTAPTTQIDASPNALSASASAEFKFSGNDGSGSGVASFECRRDSAEPSGWATCASPKQYASLVDGAHKFEVRAIDTAGNVDASPATFSWTTDTTAPATQIDASPPALSASPNAEFKFSGTDTGGSGVASFECRRDSTEPSGWATCTSPKQYASLSDGSHKFEVRAIDTAGNIDASPASFSWNVDTTTPQTQIDTSPSALSASANAEFKFSASDGSGSGVASFQCRRDSTEPAAWATCASPKSYASLLDGAHTFEVRAIDLAGNVDASPAIFNWTIDTTAPVTQIDASPPALSASASAEFKFSAGDGSGSGVASFQCRRDSSQAGDWATCTSPKTYTSLADGAHSFEVRAIDAAGNVDASPASFGWSVDTTPPVVAIDSLSKTLLGAGQSSEVHWHANENGSFVLRVGGSDCTNGTVLDSGTYSSQPAQHVSSIAATDLSEGANTLRLCLTDAASNRGSSTATVNKDSAAPNTQIDASPPALSASPNAEFKFSGSDGAGSGVASFECRRDSSEASAWAPCASPKTYSALLDGEHSFQVRAIDQAANLDASPATFTWTIDATPPTATIDSGPAGITNDSTPTFGFHSNEAGSTFQCSIDTGTPAYGPCSGPGSSHTPPSPLGDGSYTFRLRATDAAGNQGTATRSFSLDTAAPPGPDLTSTVPASPANQNSPKVLGSAPAGSTVHLYASGDCSGAPIATATPAQLAAGITVSVADDSTTQFSATDTSAAENTSACSSAISYTEDSTSPTTQIDGHPAGLTSSAAANLTFSGSDAGGSGVASFECRRDSTEPSSWSTCTSPKQYASLSDGAHSFEVRAIDQAGNVDASPASFEWTVDSTAPQTQIDTSPPALSASASAEFKFSGSDGSGSGVSSFECRRDSSEVSAWTACTSPKSYASLLDGSHKFEVRAIDQAGNVDASPAIFNWSIDTTAPTTQIDASPPSLSASASAEFKFSGADTGGSGVASFECRRDSTEANAWVACASPKSYAALTDGAHKFEVRAVDTAGNVDASPATFSWSIDTTSPNSQIDANPPALSASGSAEFRFSGSDGGGSGVASFECRRDSLEAGAWATCTSPKQYAALTDGAHKFEVRAVDTAGNVDASPATYSWSIDTTAPNTQIDASPPALSASPNAEFKFSGSDGAGSGVASFECRRDSSEASAWAPCASPKTYSALLDGEHSFQVRAIDQAANLDASPATFTWTIDATPPTATIDSGPAGITNDSTPTFGFHSNEAGSTFQCSIDTGTPAYGPCSGPGSSHTPPSPLGDGSYTFRLRATDAAGNQGTATRSFSLDTAAPPGPDLTSTVPASPANQNSPKVLGSAPAGSTVHLYASGDCSGAPIATATPAQLAAGITVSVADDSTTQFSATDTSAAENTSACSSAISYTEDSTSPTTQIDGHPENPVSSDLATFVFSATDTGGSGVASFQCRRDSSQAGDWATCTSPKTYTSLADGSHSFEVRAIDAAGNVDASPASFGWSVDTTGPQTQIDTHPATLSASAAAEFKFFATDTGGSGVSAFECRRDSAEAGAWTPCASPKQYTSLADGAHKFEVRAIDQAGNVDASPASFEWTVDTAAPSAPTLTTTVPASPSNYNSPKVVGSAADGSTVRLYASADCSGTAIAVGSAAELADGIVTSVPDDSITRFSATATSSAENTSACSSSITYIEDSSSPQTQIETGPANPSTSAAAVFGFSGSDQGGTGIASFECRLDSSGGGDWAACTSPASYANLLDGQHSFEVRAIDQAGNIDTSPATFAWSIATAGTSGTTQNESGTAPSVHLVQFKYDGSKGKALLFIEVSGAGKLTVSTPKPASAHAAGSNNAKRSSRSVQPRPQIAPRSATVNGAEVVKVSTRLSALSRRLLLEKGTVTVRVQLHFEATDGTTVTRTSKVTLRKKQ